MTEDRYTPLKSILKTNRSIDCWGWDNIITIFTQAIRGKSWVRKSYNYNFKMFILLKKHNKTKTVDLKNIVFTEKNWGYVRTMNEHNHR